MHKLILSSLRSCLERAGQVMTWDADLLVVHCPRCGGRWAYSMAGVDPMEVDRDAYRHLMQCPFRPEDYARGRQP